MIPCLKEPSGIEWTQRYESLRQQVLGESATLEWFFGLDALLQYGMAIWMHGVWTVETKHKEGGLTAATIGWLPPNQRETTWVLADMTWPLLFQKKGEALHGK